MLTLATWAVTGQARAPADWPQDEPFTALDLSTAATSNAAGGLALVASSLRSPPASHVVIADGDSPRDTRPARGAADRWQLQTGLAPQGSTLAEWIVNRLSTQAGATGCRPAIPRSGAGSLEIRLGPYSFADRFRADRTKDPRILAALAQHQAEYSAIRAASGVAAARQYLQRLVERYRLGKRPDAWRLLQGAFSGDGDPLPHGTVVTESFDKANSTTLGPDLAWTEHVADFTVSANQLAFSQAAHGYCSANQDLGTDHWSEATLPFGTTSFAGPIVRASATGPVCYAVYHVGSGLFRLRRYSGQSFTELASKTITQPGSAYPLYLEANGSTLTATTPTDPAMFGVTDTVLATQQRCGCFIYGTSPRIDSWRGGDLGAAASKGCGGPHCGITMGLGC